MEFKGNEGKIMKRFTIFTFDDIEDVNDAFGYDCFEDLIQSGDYNALKPFKNIKRDKR